ncbi:MAG: DUF5076 domain-containing protein [Litorimonas sp.]
MTDDIEELEVPPEVVDAEWAVEVLRFWIADGVDHLSLKIDAINQGEGGHHGASVWGSILADIARHVVNACSQDVNNEANREQLLAMIERGFYERIEEKFDASVVGSLKGKASAH